MMQAYKGSPATEAYELATLVPYELEVQLVAGLGKSLRCSGHAAIVDAGTRVEALLEILDQMLASKVVKELINESSAADADAAPKRAATAADADAAPKRAATAADAD